MIPAQKSSTRPAVALLAAACALSVFVAPALAQSSLGIGTNEATVPSTGLFGGLLAWINAYQQDFYRSLTGALKAMREDGSKLWLLVGLSFAYGVFHAAGPGHGKAVISSYMLANEVALKRGIMLSFVSAFLQGVVAITVMGLVFLVLRGTSVSMTDATWFLEVVSYAAIAAFGAWLLWQKTARYFVRPAASLSAASTHAHSHAHAHGHSHSRGHEHHDHHHHHAHAEAHAAHAHTTHDHHGHDHGHHHHSHEHHHGHAHGPGEVCETCGHSHAPDPAMLGGDRFTWSSAWSAVAAVGIRPCSGALIVLSFAFLNGLYAGGILSVFAMALGTAITVSALATIAVTAKNWAVAFAGDGRMGNRVHSAIEIGGAALVLLLGLVLLSASLAG